MRKLNVSIKVTGEPGEPPIRVECPLCGNSGKVTLEGEGVTLNISHIACRCGHVFMESVRGREGLLVSV